MSGNLYERLPMPSILSTGTYSIAVYSGGGSRLVKQIEALFENHDLHKALDAFGVVADADKKPPADLATKYQKAFQGLFPDFPARTCWRRRWSVPGQSTQRAYHRAVALGGAPCRLLCAAAIFMPRGRLC